MATRRKISSEDKLKILIEILQDGKSVSTAAEEHHVHPNLILKWRKQFFENASVVFERKRSDITEKSQQQKIDELEKELKSKDSVIAEIATENLALKKTFGGQSLGQKR